MKKYLLLILVLLVFAGCSGDDGNASSLTGSWNLQSIENQNLYTSPANENILLTFENSTYRGFTNNNEFGGDYEILGDSLYITNSYTSEAGETAWGNVFYKALRKAYDEKYERAEFKYVRRGKQLTLRSLGDVMVFARKE